MDDRIRGSKIEFSLIDGRKVIGYLEESSDTTIAYRTELPSGELYTLDRSLIVDHELLFTYGDLMPLIKSSEKLLKLTEEAGAFAEK